ncbi:MAG: radical SAM protein [Alphaproteobacteria bacterium]|nr:radical SAM protein [Alphaproteobacteria bacterium]
MQSHAKCPVPPARRRPPRKRVLIVNAFLDEYRRTRGSPFRVPRAMGPPTLAGAFAPDLWDIRLFNEQYSGLLTDLDLLGWPDLLVLTGVTTSFDRMKQLTAYARTLNEKVIVVAGGPPVRALPNLSRSIFDYACTGDVEQLQDVVRDAFGRDYAADVMEPRLDLPYGGGMFGYVEASRACNFRCSFCSLTGEGAAYRNYDLAMVRRQIEAVGKKQICFIDNNFYGNDRDAFLAKVALCKEFYEAGKIKGWSCLVAGDFFARPENLELVRAAGCKALFSGIESFDQETLKSYNKKQNAIVPQIEMITNCLEAGIVFTYGVMLDPTTRRIADLRNEIEFILSKPQITLPAYFTLAIPLIGTPYFYQCLDKGAFFPNTRLRNLDGVTLTMQPLDPLDEVMEFVRGLISIRGYRHAALRHSMAFARRYHGVLEPMQLYASLLAAALICTEFFASSPGRRQTGRPKQTFYGPTEILDPCYTPLVPIAARYADHFAPTLVTDETGALHPGIAGDLAQPRDAKPGGRRQVGLAVV